MVSKIERTRCPECGFDSVITDGDRKYCERGAPVCTWDNECECEDYSVCGNVSHRSENERCPICEHKHEHVCFSNPINNTDIKICKNCGDSYIQPSLEDGVCPYGAIMGCKPKPISEGNYVTFA